ncbi:MAG: CusA/CzcA family heavy metal efflux RND transporter [Candidatus Eisenbacteria bacterium]
MLERIIRFSIDNRAMVFLLTLFLVVGGVYSIYKIKLDAIPDLSDVQVIIQVDYAGQSPNVVEDQVTYPLTTAMLNVPKAKVVRGYSFFGFGFVYILFEDGTDIYWARSRVLEYLNQVELPEMATLRLGPDATGLGWVYEYVLTDTTGAHDLSELRSLQDFFLKYELTAVPGVSEVASIGGFVKQYQVEVDPRALQAYGIPIQKVRAAIRNSNQDVGGRLIEMGETEYMVRGRGYLSGIEDIENVVLGVGEQGAPVLLGDVAHVSIGPELRRGIAEWNGEGEVVGGIVVMRYGENALDVIDRVKEKLESLRSGLPPGVEIHTGYDRSVLIREAIHTLKMKLTEELVVVAIICAVFLLHLPSAFVAIVTLPVGVLASIMMMNILGINANIMSLGGIAIAIGVMVDASLVLVENAHKHAEREADVPHKERIFHASKEVGPSLFFALLIITVSFMPVFALGEQSGRLFKPLAFTKTFAMAASSILAITLIPALMTVFVRGRMRKESANPISRGIIAVYRPLIRWVLGHRVVTILIAAAVLALTLIPISRIGSEFMPPLYEGDLLYMPTTPPGLSITKAKEILQQTDKIIGSFPEVHHVLGKIGRARTATDPAPLSMIETTIMLEKDHSKWREGVTVDSLIKELDAAIQFPGLTNARTMPIKTRIDMLSTGIKTPVGIKILGDDLGELSAIGERIEALVKGLPGTLSAYSQRAVGGNFVDFRIDREATSRYGLNVGDVQDVIMSAIGGMNVTYTVEGLERYPVNVRYPRELRSNLEDLRAVLVPTPGGAQVPIGQLAEIEVVKGPPLIQTENARRTVWVFVDIQGVDIGTYVKNAQRAVREGIDLPPGYSIIWSGQFEYMQAAAARFKILIPLTVFIVFLLLYMHFKSMAECFVRLLPLPFAVVGGFWLMWILGYNTSVAVWVGFIAVAGLATETGIVMQVYLDEATNRYRREGRLRTRDDLHAAIAEGAVDRVRPKMMTVATTLVGLLPIMLGGEMEIGASVMKRIAAPMVGGLVTSTIETLLVIPVIYSIWKGRGLGK